MNKDSSWIEKKLQFCHRGNCPADIVVDGAADLKKCTCPVADAVVDIQAHIERIIGEDEPEDDMQPSVWVTRKAQNKLRTEQRQRAGITPQSGKEEVFEQD